MRDANLTRSYRLSSWPCWQYATPSDAIAMRWVALNVLQPVTDRWGPVRITSWKRWARSGCRESRTGDHADAGTVDLVPELAPIEDVWRWMGANLRGRYGSLINERDHIHYTRTGVGVAPGRTEFLYEPTEGVYTAASVGPSTLAVAVAIGAAVYVLSNLKESPS